MFQVRIHGRGGQGVVTAAELLSIAAFEDGKHAQAFPTFGSERAGAPVVSYCRIDERPIRVREPVAEPDALIVQDPTLLHQVDLFGGVGDDAFVLVNTGRSFDELGIGEYVRRFRRERLLTVPAGEIAERQIGRRLPNAALLGGFAAISGVVSLQSVIKAISQKFSGEVADGNARAANAAHEHVRREIRELSHA
jgi:pyruvate ferredoxin oxidoreductase gamma subunit